MSIKTVRGAIKARNMNTILDICKLSITTLNLLFCTSFEKIKIYYGFHHPKRIGIPRIKSEVTGWNIELLSKLVDLTR